MKALPALVALLLTLSPLLPARAAIHFDACHERTGSSATLIVPASAIDLNGAEMQFADELAVFTPEGVCAGWAQWNGSNVALAVWEDNPMTQAIDGFMPGDAMQYVIWDESAGIEYGQESPIDVTYHADFEGEDLFIPDAVYLVSSLVATTPYEGSSGTPLAFALTGNYPNPFTDRTTIGYELPEETLVKVEVYNLLGHRVEVLVHEVQPAGRHEVLFSTAPGTASGVYVVRLQAGSHTSHRKMVVVN
jgi:hypothetical protein